MRIARVASLSGLWLGSAEKSPHPLMARKPDPARAIFALLPTALPHGCILVAQDGQAIAVPPDDQPTHALALRLLQTDRPGLVRLRHPFAERGFLALTDARPDAPASALRLDGTGQVAEAALLALIPAAADQVPAVIHTLAREIGAVAAQGLRAEPFLAQLRARTLRPALAASLLRLMHKDELADLAGRALENPADLALLRWALPHDPWIATHLPALASWRHTRAGAPQGKIHVPLAASAALPHAQPFGLPTPGLAVLALARARILPRRGACILATARNEGPYLLDWIAYHLAIGFEHIFLYTNDNDDGSDPLLNLLAQHGIITLLENPAGPNLPAQHKAYGHALSLLPHILEYRWTAILDLDEYLCLDSAMYPDISAFLALQEAQPVDAIALCWVIFSAARAAPATPGSTPERFTLRNPGVDMHVKSLFRTRLFWNSQPHYPYATLDAPFDFRTELAQVHYTRDAPSRSPPFAAAPSANHAWVNHYYLRTAPEALWKWSRGRADRPHPDPDEFLAAIARHFLNLSKPGQQKQDRRILDRAPASAARLARLRALPGIAEAESAIMDRFTERLAHICAGFLAKPLPPDASEDVREFQACVAMATEKKKEVLF
jgi:hypothetical protein